MKSIFEFMNYRDYLKEAYQELKKKNPLISYRAFNRLTGFKSPAFFKLVMEDKKNLADEGIYKIALGLKLNEAETNYFDVLVKFNQAQTHEEKDRYFRKLLDQNKFVQANPLVAAQYRLFSHWYYVAIIELLRLKTDLKKNADWLQSQLSPEVELRDIKKALNVLKILGLLTESKNGEFKSTEQMLSTPDEVPSLYVKNFHAQMCHLAANSVLNHRPEHRQFSTLTIALSNDGFLKMKKEIQSFQKKLHSIFAQDKKMKTRVGHVNLQLFTLNRSES